MSNEILPQFVIASAIVFVLQLLSAEPRFQPVQESFNILWSIEQARNFCHLTDGAD